MSFFPRCSPWEISTPSAGRVSPAVPRERFQQELLVGSFCEAARLARWARPRWRLIRERRYHALAEPWVREPRSIAVNDVIKCAGSAGGRQNALNF